LEDAFTEGSSRRRSKSNKAPLRWKRSRSPSLRVHGRAVSAGVSSKAVSAEAPQPSPTGDTDTEALEVKVVSAGGWLEEAAKAEADEEAVAQSILATGEAALTEPPATVKARDISAGFVVLEPPNPAAGPKQPPYPPRLVQPAEPDPPASAEPARRDIRSPERQPSWWESSTWAGTWADSWGASTWETDDWSSWQSGGFKSRTSARHFFPQKVAKICLPLGPMGLYALHCVGRAYPQFVGPAAVLSSRGFRIGVSMGPQVSRLRSVAEDFTVKFALGLCFAGGVWAKEPLSRGVV
jgi:hypothetical protein